MSPSRRRRKPPLEIMLTFRMNFGDNRSDAMTLIDNQRVPLAGSIFENRDRITRSFLRLLLIAGTMQPKVLGAVLSLRRRWEREP